MRRLAAATILVAVLTVCPARAQLPQTCDMPPKDPTDRFIRAAVDVDAHQSAPLKTVRWYWPFNKVPPRIMSANDVMNEKCNTGDPKTEYLYKYTFRVSDKGSDDHGKSDQDPDLEVSPPPGVQVPPRRQE